MSKRLTGLNPLAYIGVEPVQPVNTFMRSFPPGPTDSRNVNIGDFWIDTNAQQLWVLVSLAGGVASWITLFGGGADHFVTDAGTAIPSGGILNVNGDGLNIATTGSGDTIVIRENPDPTFGNVTITGTLDLSSLTEGVLVTNNSGDVSSVATTNHSLLVGNATGTISSLGVATNGEIPIGSTGANPVLATITAGSGITVTNGAGSITIAATGAELTFDADSGSATPSGGVITFHGGTGVTTSAAGSTVTINSTGAGFPYTDEAVSFNALSNNGYFVSAVATATMPASPSEGDRIEFIVDTASVLTVTGNTGQVLRIGSAVSASAGTAASSARGDAVSFIYRSADTAWIALSVIGTWTIT